MAASDGDQTRAARPWRPEVDLFFEDFEPGQEFALGQHLIQEAEILEFARSFDPQPFHVDPELARGTIFQGLIASGWHSCAIWMRLYYDAVLSHAASLGSPGVEQIRWLRPVRPGDVLVGGAQVISTRPSASGQDRGTAVLQGELRDRDGEVKMRLTVWGLFALRPSGG